VTGEIRSGTDRHWPDLEDAQFARGEEFARFNLGSTVVLVLPKACARLDASVQAGMSLRVGQGIGTIATPQAGRTP
jgi:phosphatidylserine decarboxylase